MLAIYIIAFYTYRNHFQVITMQTFPFSLRTCLVSLTCALSLLSGCAPMLAGSATGVVASNPKDLGQVSTDAWIKTQIVQALTVSPQPDMMLNIHVEVNNGRVLLTGQTLNQDTAREAVRLAWEVRGVKEVMNSIQLTHAKTIADTASDGWILAQIKSHLFFNQRVRSINYTIEVENGIVYVLGTARDGNELQIVTHTISRVSGVQRVVSYVRTRDSKPSVKIGK
jgi:osmotically-inducible protein OsmY